MLVVHSGVMLVVGLLVLAATTLPLPVLTGIGVRRRGVTIPMAVLAGILFPVAWVVWYARDEQPYRRDH